MNLKYTKFQKIIEVITIILLLSIWIYLIISWGTLPDKIPGHYNAAGVVDRWVSKGNIIIVPIISVMMYALLTAASFFPSMWNVPVNTTNENKEFVYLNVKSMLILLKLEIVSVFAYIAYCNLNAKSLGIWFLPIELGLIFGTTIYYMIKVNRKR